MKLRCGRIFWLATAIFVVSCIPARAAVYRIIPSAQDVVPGGTYAMRAEVETEAGDNVVDAGFFSFAIDLTVSGSAAATAIDINNIVLNTIDFDDLLGSSLGHPMGDQFVGIAGVTSNFLAPTFGHQLGDVTWLFDFDLTIPLTSLAGDTVILTPAEGALENLIVSETFDAVTPQVFEPATLTVVPEPTTGLLLVLVSGCFAISRRALAVGAVVKAGGGGCFPHPRCAS